RPLEAMRLPNGRRWNAERQGDASQGTVAAGAPAVTMRSTPYTMTAPLVRTLGVIQPSRSGSSRAPLLAGRTLPRSRITRALPDTVAVAIVSGVTRIVRVGMPLTASR